MSIYGLNAFGLVPKQGGGAPFPAGTANNGLSVDPTTGKIVLGEDVGTGTLSTLDSDRMIVTTGNFGIVLTANSSDPNTRTNRISDSNMRMFEGFTGSEISMGVQGVDPLLKLGWGSGFGTKGEIQFGADGGASASLFADASGITMLSGGGAAKVFAGGNVTVGPSAGFIDGGTALFVTGEIKTLAAAPLTTTAGAIRFGSVKVSAAVLDATRYFETVINGSLVKLAIIT